jgi:WD40 repeat protein
MKSPFKFLDSYTKDDREIFFGREREIEELYHRVFESKIMLVYGVSGTGKSSLIHCGLANKFQETDWLPLAVRRGGNLPLSIAEAIRGASLTPQSKEISTPAQFRKAARSLYLDHYKPLFFIFDQFEELFIFGGRDERKLSIDLVKSLVESDIQCRFIFVLREEYMAGFTEFEKYIPTIFQNRVRIEKMSQANAVEAIIGPCRVAGIEVEEGFAEALLEKLSPGGGDIELTYLQVFLDRLLKISGTEGTAFTKELLDRAGNVPDLLGIFVDEQISLLADPEKGMGILKSFVSVKGTKKMLTFDEVYETSKTYAVIILKDELSELLRNFIRLRILQEKDQNGRYELRHDALAARIFEKITSSERERIEIAQLLENAFDKWEKRGILLSAEDIEFIKPHEDFLYLTKDVFDFLEKSKDVLRKAQDDAERARKRKNNFFIAAGIGLLLIFAGFTLWALKERNKSINQERIARANSYNFMAQKVVETNATAALRIAEYSKKLDPENEEIETFIRTLYYENCFYKIIARPEYRIWTLKFSPDGNSFLIGTGYKEASLYDIKGNVKAVLKGHEKGIRSAAFTHDGTKILTGSFDNSAKMWDLQGINTATFKGHSKSVTCLAFSPDEKHVVTGSNDTTAIIWDIRGKKLCQLKGHTGGLIMTEFSKGGDSVVTASVDNTIRMWNLKGALLKVISIKGQPLESVQSFPGGREFLCISEDGKIFKLSIEGQSESISISSKQVSMSVARLSSDGKRLIVGYLDNTISIFDLYGNLITTMSGSEQDVYNIEVSENHKHLLTSNSYGGVYLWNIKGIDVTNLQEKWTTSVRFSPDGRSILAGSYDSSALLLNLDGKIVTRYFGHKGFVSAVAFSPDGKTILTGSYDKTAKLWNLEGKEILTLEGHKRAVLSVSFSRDGKYILTGSDDNTAILWDFQGKALIVFKGFSQGISSVAFSPDGTKILLAAADNTVILYDRQGNKLMELLSGTDGECVSVLFSGDGKTILTGSSNFIKIWDINGSLLKKMEVSEQVSALALSPDNKYLVASCFDSKIFLFDLDGYLWKIYKGHETDILGLDFAPDGERFVSSSKDGKIKIWEIKEDLSSFRENNNYEELSTGQLIDYKILSYDEILKSKNLKLISEAAKYFLLLRSTQNEKLQLQNFVYSKELYKKAITLYESADNLLGLANADIEIFKVQKKQEIILEVNKVLDDLTKRESDKDNLAVIEFCFNRSINLDTVSSLLRLPERLAELCEKTVSHLPALDPERNELAILLSNLSLEIARKKDFRLSLKLIQLSIESDSTLEVAKTNLPLIYLLNGQYDKASEIYIKLKDKPFYSDFRIHTFKEAFLNDITDLENSGMENENFEKIKQLLK